VRDFGRTDWIMIEPSRPGQVSSFPVRDAPGLSRGVSRSLLQRQKVCEMPRACPGESHVRCYKGRRNSHVLLLPEVATNVKLPGASPGHLVFPRGIRLCSSKRETHRDKPGASTRQASRTGKVGREHRHPDGPRKARPECCVTPARSDTTLAGRGASCYLQKTCCDEVLFHAPCELKQYSGDEEERRPRGSGSGYQYADTLPSMRRSSAPWYAPVFRSTRIVCASPWRIPVTLCPIAFNLTTASG